jgi:UDP-2-acetamido-2,6-beta-L-arabino-hexul-4-ose reductase
VATLKTILVTGSGGFLGRNLIQMLSGRDDIRVLEYEVDDSRDELDKALHIADVIVHLAGVNRPKSTDEYMAGNAEFTRSICDTLRTATRAPESSCLHQSKQNWIIPMASASDGPRKN